MVYNPDFFEPLTDEQRSGVLIHEFYHLVFEHVTGRLPDELEGAMVNPTQAQRQLFKLWNIGADLSINYHIGRSRLPEGCCFPGEGPFEDLDTGMTAEWYYEQLKSKMQEQDDEEGGNGEPGDGQPGRFDPDNAGQFDSHDDWGGEASDQATQEIARERLKEAMRQATDEAAKASSWGTVSASVRREIMDRLQTKVDWRKVLSWFVKCSQRSNKKSTPRRLNKRYAYIHPGRRIERVANIAVSVDQSGSVSDAMLASFYSELNKLAEVATFTVIPFDTRVAEDKVYVWKKGEKRKRERVMYGGTDFNPPTEYVNKGNFDGHIVLTDMCAPKPKRSTCPRMWMTDGVNGRNPYFKTNERIVIVD